MSNPSPFIRLAYLLTELFPDEATSIRMMTQSGIQSGHIQTNQRPLNRWLDIASEARNDGKLPALLSAALAEYPTHAGLLRLQVELAASDSKPILIAAIGADAALSLDLAALRAVRTATGLEFARILYATLPALKTALDRERRKGRPCYVHLAVHSGPQGVELGGQVVDAAALSEVLDGVLVLLIAGCESDQIGDFLGVVPTVVTISEKVSMSDASLFSMAWWSQIGLGVEPGEALRTALQQAPSGLREYVVRNF